MGCTIGQVDPDDLLVPPEAAGEEHHAQIWVSCCGEDFVNGVYQFVESHSTVRYCKDDSADVFIFWDESSTEWRIVIESSGVVLFRADPGDHGARILPQEGWEVVSGKAPVPTVVSMRFSMVSSLRQRVSKSLVPEEPQTNRQSVDEDDARAADFIALLPSPWLGDAKQHEASAAVLQEMTSRRRHISSGPPGWSDHREPKVISYTMPKPKLQRDEPQTKSLYSNLHIVSEVGEMWLDEFLVLAGLTRHGVIATADSPQELAGIAAWSSRTKAEGLTLRTAGRLWVIHKGCFNANLAELVVEEGGDEHGVWSSAEWQNVKALYQAVAGNPSSQAAAACRVLGHREHKAEEKRNWYLAAAKGHDVSAMLGLALHCEEDLDKRRAWCMKAAEYGDPRAYTLLGLLEANLALQREWYMKAAASGHAAAMIYLGRMEEHRSLKRGWYEKAVMLGHPDAHYNLGLIEHDVDKKRKYYLKAAVAGHARAMLALAHEEDVAVDGDAAVAQRWYLEAAKLGHADGMFHLAACCEVEISEKRKWYLDAAERGHAGAMYLLSCLAVDPFEQREWLIKAANAGCAKAMIQLGTLEFSPELRDEWYQKATDGGYDPFLMPLA